MHFTSVAALVIVSILFPNHHETVQTLPAPIPETTSEVVTSQNTIPPGTYVVTGVFPDGTNGGYKLKLEEIDSSGNPTGNTQTTWYPLPLPIGTPLVF